MSNPVLVEVTRGGRVESRHRGFIAVCDEDGALVWSAGETATPVFPRSGVKAMQALPLVESGAADRFGFGERELALASASHSGEPEHVALAASMLAAAGLDQGALECGAHWPERAPMLAMSARGETPTALHNNCSGKHAGFLCTACHRGIDAGGYIGFAHPVQAAIREVFADLSGEPVGAETCGTDGCSIPTYAMPLAAIAKGFARMATGKGLSRERAAASRRIIAACMAEPFFVAGTGRFCTDLMRAGVGRIFAKTGAEGVYCAILPERGLGIAVKCEDGATRAAETMVAATLARLVGAQDPLQVALMALARRGQSNWNGIATGEVRPAGPLAA